MLLKEFSHGLTKLEGERWTQMPLNQYIIATEDRVSTTEATFRQTGPKIPHQPNIRLRLRSTLFIFPQEIDSPSFFLFLFLLRFYLLIFREKGREGERHGEKHPSAASRTRPNWETSCNPDMCLACALTRN